ncbi:MAG TPA: DUF72 domain-containing protein [Chthoniobacterales bacterium]|nr:DUF72 domain-containing protein [Chthoniobacterales bacterium]
MRKAPHTSAKRRAPGCDLEESEESFRWPASRLRIGISGWTYPRWRKVFYPTNLAQRLELNFASRQFNSIEINVSFYSLQRPSSYQHWYAETPAGFVFSVKGPRFITHMKKLREVETPLANFFASGVLALREKLGPILWQFPPNFGWNEERFRTFFELLPRETKAAAKLAQQHNEKLKHGAWTKTDRSRPLQYAVEIRHQSFLVPEFFALLRAHKVAFVFADTARKWPYAEDLTADLVYCRLHGAEELYVSGYTDSALDWWANRLRHWRRGAQPEDAHLIAPRKVKTSARDVYIYFDNDAKVHAPFDARRFAQRL